jgi:hypothetical protein
MDNSESFFLNVNDRPVRDCRVLPTGTLIEFECNECGTPDKEPPKCYFCREQHFTRKNHPELFHLALPHLSGPGRPPWAF